MPYKVIAYLNPDETQPELLGVGINACQNIEQSAYAQCKMDLNACLLVYLHNTKST